MVASSGAPRVIVPGILLAGLGLRLWDLRQPFIGDFAWNEAYYAQLARSFLTGSLLVQADFHGETVTSSPLVPWMIWASFRVFGVTEWAGRLPILLTGIAAVIIFYLLARAVYGNDIAVPAVCLASTAPGLVFFSRNIQLDGAMTTFGLAAVLALTYYRRRERRIWLCVSLLAFALAILIKYPAVLFWPALAWIWFDRASLRPPVRWAEFIAYTVAALVPSIVWLTMGPVSPLTSQYFVRPAEFGLRHYAAALLTLWPRAGTHLGLAVWYPTAVVGLALLLLSRLSTVVAFARRHSLALLLIAPWYLQLVYPRSWIANEYYDYPALFGICLVLASLWLTVYKRTVEWLGTDRRRSLLAASCCAALVTLSNAWDYRAFFHRAYYPWPIISQPSPFYSARLVAELNAGRHAVLTDLWFTCYYADCLAGGGQSVWWGESDTSTVAAVTSGRYEFIVFTYPPTIGIVTAIQASGYRQIAPAAWRRSPRQ